ncbi:hypothetical protein MTAT_19500 [Moorella thermoacetica]|uniref:Uncharacterized protein n=1 Tax=Neomoorella thermoacetica TaxID=1525 RepID=A0AAC9HIK8_NEOTH|nr:hypothetical protein [Moorella thermoacetica]AOQ24607.1 hypothetical protein Maut_02177 [Moorella thermoacetica]TYL12708.1 hypothetical protein MTAT_19500 [Moorella thermoacetica]
MENNNQAINWRDRYIAWFSQNFGRQWYGKVIELATSEDERIADIGQFLLLLTEKLYELEVER